MKLTIYLLRQSVGDFEGVIPEHYTAGGGYNEIEPRLGLPFPCRAWLQQNKTKPPRWLEWISTGFDLSESQLVNQYSSFVLLLETAARKFAVTFGYGFNAVDRAIVEPDFGLRMTLNAVNPNALDTIDTRTLDRVTKQTRTHLNVGRPVDEFGIEPDLDWLRSVRGMAEGQGITGKLQGADSVRVNWKGQLATLAECCGTLLTFYLSDRYKRHFGFIDHLRPLLFDDPLRSLLEQRVQELLFNQDSDWLTVAHPDVPSPDVDSFKIWSGNFNRENIDELDLDVVFSFLADYENTKGERPDIHKTWVIALDSQGEARSQKTSLWKYLVAHIEREEHTYVLSLGQWFQTDRDYLDELRRKVVAIEDVSEQLSLHAWAKGVNEGEYNRTLAEEHGWLLLDRSMFTFGDSGNKIECADLLTSKQDFIHVKSMSSSATLSHLFSQGTVSAKLFRTMNDYREEVAAKFNGKYETEFVMDPSKSRVVYAIGTSKDGALAETLFFFSLVNLVQHKEMLDAMGWRMALCRIPRRGNE